MSRAMSSDRPSPALAQSRAALTAASRTASALMPGYPLKAEVRELHFHYPERHALKGVNLPVPERTVDSAAKPANR